MTHNMSTKLEKQVKEISHHARMLRAKLEVALDSQSFKTEWEMYFGGGMAGHTFVRLLGSVCEMSDKVDLP